MVAACRGLAGLRLALRPLRNGCLAQLFQGVPIAKVDRFGRRPERKQPTAAKTNLSPAAFVAAS